MSHHGSITDPTNLHRSHAYEYADAAARGAATDIVPGDVGKLAWQQDDDTLWILTDDSPLTWVQVGGGGGATYTAENARDDLAAALTAGTGITVTPNDGADIITIATTITQYTDEMARDALGTALTAGAGITVTPNDGADTIAIASTITQYTDEMAQDAVGTILTDSSSIDFTYTDGSNQITAAAIFGTSAGTVSEGNHNHDSRYYTESEVDTLIAGAGGYTAENARDDVGAALVAGNNIDITINDGANTITIDVESLTSADITDFTEASQDVIGTLLADSTNIDMTYNDGANTFAVDLTAVAKTFKVTILIDGGGSVITAGLKGGFKATGCTVTAWEVVSIDNVSGSIVIDLWSDTYANFPPVVGDSICGAEKPTLSSAVKAQDTSLNGGAGWTLTDGNWVLYNVEATPASVKLIALALTCVRP